MEPIRAGEFTIRQINESDLEKIRRFTDEAIGTGYYTLAELREILKKSQSGNVTSSLLLEDEQGFIRGIRLTYPHGNWQKGKGEGLSPDLWRVALSEVAYFQSLFVDSTLTNQGWGSQLSQASLGILRGLGSKAVVCHSWRESPSDSSGKYLRKLGFQHVASHPKYWYHVDYQCPLCGKPCVCTADEMILYL